MQKLTFYISNLYKLKEIVEKKLCNMNKIFVKFGKEGDLTISLSYYIM